LPIATAPAKAVGIIAFGHNLAPGEIPNNGAVLLGLLPAVQRQQCSSIRGNRDHSCRPNLGTKSQAIKHNSKKYMFFKRSHIPCLRQGETRPTLNPSRLLNCLSRSSTSSTVQPDCISAKSDTMAARDEAYTINQFISK
jgi:hypothetical protein